MNTLVPDESPFASREFARFWDGWKGRRCCELEVDGFRFPYVDHSIGPLHTYAALPFGIPIFVDDTNPTHQQWIDTFFGLKCSYHSSLAMYKTPAGQYPGVRWHQQERSLVDLSGDWRANVKSSVERKVRQAERAGWSVRDLDQADLERADDAIAETDQRHGMPVRFAAADLIHLLQSVKEPGRLRIWGAVRGDDVGGMWVILAAGGYETGWLFYTSNTARAEGVAPLLTYTWIDKRAAAGAACIDLGASPNDGVRRFKSTFGAKPAPLFFGIRRWHLWGR